jgi:hypothetical protein
MPFDPFQPPSPTTAVPKLSPSSHTVKTTGSDPKNSTEEEGYFQTHEK